MTDNERTGLIRQLNDKLRKQHSGGHVMITPGIRALGTATMRHVLSKVAQFDTFTDDNDPYEEHDYGSLHVQGKRIMWKIDYYDSKMTYASPDPADPAVTERVLTVMLAEEY